MRSDMDKVIVERPRHGSRMRGPSKGYRRAFERCAWEDQPKREKIRLNKSKHLNEHLGPLRRYLRSQVGRPWNKVHAEICANISRDSAVQDHVRDHVDGYVETQVEYIDGVACHAAGYSIGRPLFSLFYVCPRTGVLKENAQGRSWKRYLRPKKFLMYVLSDDERLVRRDGVWLLARFQTVPQREWCARQRRLLAAWETRRWDVLYDRFLTFDDAQRIYGQSIHACEMRLARRKEVRAVVNSYPFTNIVRR